MSRIDYSKWDNIEDSDSSDDDDEEERTSAMPRVTRLEEPSQVSFGGPNNTTTNGSACIDITPTTAQTTPSAPSHHHGNRNTRNISTHSSASTTVSSWTDRGGMVELEPRAAHNEEAATTTTRTLYWSQDRYSVTLRVQLHDRGRSMEHDAPLEEGDKDKAPHS